MNDLTGRVAVVTGASRGIGRAIATGLRAGGATVVISGRDLAQLTSTADEIDATAVQADASDASEAARPVQVALADHGRIDILVNNVGGARPTFEATVATSLFSAHWASAAAIPPMADAGFGRIVNIASGSARRAVGSPAYTAAKHGLLGLSRQLAQDHGTDGITVNAVLPGWTDTDMVDFDKIGARQGTTADQARADAAATAAQNRIIAPHEIAPLVVFLASPEAGAITGQTIGADGGFRL